MIKDKKNHRTIVLGIDGASFKIIRPMIAQGKLENLSRIIKEGVHGDLRSRLPILSPSIWTTISTGMNPGKHGIYDFFRESEGGIGVSFNSSLDRKVKPLWVILSEHRKTVSVAEVLLTYPPDQVNGDMVSTLLISNQAMLSKNAHPRTFPVGLSDEILGSIGTFSKARVKGSKVVRKGQVSTDLLKSVDYRVKMFRHLLKKQPDFSMFYFGETDLVSHMAWQESKTGEIILNDMISQTYSKIDHFIGEILAEPDTDLLIVSDHGFQALNKTVSLNNFLESIGLLKYHPIPFSTRVRRLINKTPLRRLLGKQTDMRRMEVDELVQGIDWHGTKAYCFGTTGGTIFLNLRDKNERGIVSEADSDSLCDFIISKLKDLKDPETDQLVIKEVYKKEQIFTGQYQQYAPDICILFNEGYGMKIKKDERFTKKEIVVHTEDWHGDHAIDGIFMAAGPHFKKEALLSGASVHDIAPTILHLMGVPVVKEMDGKVLLDALDPVFVASHPVEYEEGKVETKSQDPKEQAYSAEDEKLLAERLQDLGYLD